ncbi:short-chain dehydrogenase [Siphonobacter sp. BAB-5385]|uniref:SDR family NAD(P)-dependent oxidoreductase n=1 Tax=Siphonobacter sp. BAB-5385 TaxID=1864822 RepID=UPI000B9E7808|nr:SDR family oxidoreductase [Siphonobacter sp. BAB-5385]OZI06114.1 short-chain dehydrogenase [Siphonobacter sp. BAB-5385]
MPYALITGAAQGIGRAIAEQLAQRHYDLLLVDQQEEKLYRTAEALRKTYGVNIHVLTLDLALPGFLRVLRVWQQQVGSTLEILVNNAGFGLNGSFEELSIQEQLDIMNVNIRAVMEITHAFLPLLKKQPKAYLLNVCSTTAYQTVPYLTVYAASKAFILSFTRGLRHELRGSSVQVTMLSPGSTDTGFVDRARMGESLKKTATKVHMTPQAVAELAVRALFAGKAEVIPGFVNWVGAWLPKVVPMRWIERVIGGIYQPKHIASKEEKVRAFQP